MNQKPAGRYTAETVLILTSARESAWILVSSGHTICGVLLSIGMEDRWFVFSSNGWLYFHRCLTESGAILVRYFFVCVHRN